MSKFKQVDLWFSEIGDLAVDRSGDLKDTKGSYGRAILQEVRDRLRGSVGDWKLTPQFGANVKDFLGDAGTRLNINRIVTRVIEALAFDGLLDQAELNIIPLQIVDSTVLFRILIVTREGELTSTFAFDTNENRFIGY